MHAPTPQAQQLPAAQPAADLYQEVVAVEKGRHAARNRPNSSRVKVRRRAWPKTCSGSTSRGGASTSRTGLVAISRTLRAASMMRSRIDRQAITPLWLSQPSRSFCQRSTIEGVI
jgi:hypothetical protein